MIRRTIITKASLLAGLLIGMALAVGRPAVALAGDPAHVALWPPGDLISGPAFSPSLGGTYIQRTAVNGGELSAEITLQLPPADTPAEPGPVVVLWQLLVTVSDTTHGDSAERLVGPPQVYVAVPNCDSGGNCAVRLRLSGPVAPALEASDLEWVLHTALSVRATVVRTFGGGAQLQIVKFDWSGDADGGTLASPSDTYGALNLSPPFPANEAAPAEIPGGEFWRGGAAFDWAGAVQRALVAFAPPERPEPVPISVWTPERRDAMHVALRIDFSDSCPMDRFIVFRDQRSLEVGASLFAGGANSLYSDVALPLDGQWVVSLEDGSGEVFNATDLQPLGTGVGIEISGPLRCTTGKGVFTQEGILQVIPNPSADESGLPAAGNEPGADSTPPIVDSIRLGLLGVAAVAFGAALWLLRRVQNRRAGAQAGRGRTAH